MASSKLSALSAVTSTDDASLILVADTTDSGSTFDSKKITKANLLSGQATETYVTTQINALIDSAPGALNTLNELAAAIGDDANYSTTVTNLVAANEVHIDNFATLSGVAKDTTTLGDFTGSTISSSSDLKAALQALETSLELKAAASALTAHLNTSALKFTDIADLVTLTGIAENTDNLGNFTGSTISDSVTIKSALQALETAVEAAEAGSATADQLKTVTATADATHYLTFVTDDNASSTVETFYTDAGVAYNPDSNLLTVGEVSVTTLDIGGVDVTSTAAELNILDGVTATATELNHVSGVTSAIQTQVDLKSPLASPTFTGTLAAPTINASTALQIGGVAVTSTAAELNLLDGATASTTEFNHVTGVTSAIQTQLDTKCATGANVNTLVANTAAVAAPATYYFLVVDQSDGSIKVVDKSFLELD